jgi:aspartate 1-decarboxylase
MKTYLSAKIHQATVTEANLEYVGSITIDTALMEMVGIEPFEKVMVVSNATGARLETYAITGEKNSGIICMNGASSHLIKKGEEVIIMAFGISDTPFEPKQILVDDQNRFVRYL